MIGLQESFEDFCRELAARYDLDLGEPRFANRTQPVDVDSALRDRIAEDNALDIELYEFAVALHASRVASSQR